MHDAFGEVHMLSHLGVAANRADIMRLQLLEAENAALAETVARQQAQLRDAILARDAEIDALRATVAAACAEDGANAPNGADGVAEGRPDL